MEINKALIIATALMSGLVSTTNIYTVQHNGSQKIENDVVQNALDKELGEALLKAARDGDKHSVKSLLTQNVPVNYKNELGQTSLMWASCNGHSAIVTMLLEAGAQVNVLGRGMTPLMLAAMFGHVNIVHQLLKARDAQDSINRQNEQGMTALMFSCFAGDATIINLLLDAKAQVDIANETGATALMVAVCQNKPDVVRALLRDKIIRQQIDMRDKDGNSALMLAAFYGYAEICAILLQKKLMLICQMEINLRL